MQVPYLQDSEAPPSEQQLAEIEKSIGFTFPATYRKFLLAANGGYFRQEVVFVEEGSEDDDSDWCYVPELYGVHTESGWPDVGDLVKEIRAQRERLPEEFIPIGHTDGDQLCLGIAPLFEGAVWLWDHEGHEEGPLANMSFVCRDFGEFLDGLCLAPDIEFEETIPLFLAIEEGDIREVMALCDTDSVRDVSNERGLSPLHFAASCPQPKAIPPLLNAGCSIEKADTDGNTPLAHAAKAISVDCGELLLAAGANVNTRNRQGETPLMQAAWDGSARLLARLVRSGADVNATRNDGLSALMMCLCNERSRQVLLDAGAKVPMRDDLELQIPREIPPDWDKSRVNAEYCKLHEGMDEVIQKMAQKGNSEGHGDELLLKLDLLAKLGTRLFDTVR